MGVAPVRGRQGVLSGDIDQEACPPPVDLEPAGPWRVDSGIQTQTGALLAAQ